MDRNNAHDDDSHNNDLETSLASVTSLLKTSEEDTDESFCQEQDTSNEVFAPCPDVLPYEDIFGKDHKVRTWEDVMEDREEMTIRSWAEDLNGKDMRYGRKDRKTFTYKVLKQDMLGNSSFGNLKRVLMKHEPQEAS